ncbi:MAG: nitrite reductase [Acidobacteria bacterium]|nr:MAG: nitrite reductase [Acidobacteriota bacterium]PIE91583.1 MAG: nitrite reductase [Acidobacteriota bacterium]
MTEEKKPQARNATKHYLHYPKGRFPPHLAYGFRPVFLLLPGYMLLSIIMWGLSFSGVLPLMFMDHPLEWHGFELLFGVGIAGIMAFILTGLPELFPGVVPIVGKRLQFLVGLWLLGRLSFWLIDWITVYPVALINLALFGIILAYAFKPVILDPLQRHASIGYMLIGLFLVEGWFFLSLTGIVETSSYQVMKITVGGFMLLDLLVLRRVNMESINEILEEEEADETFFARGPRYNLAFFAVLLFTLVEFLMPQNTVLGWLGLAAASAILGILSDFVLDDTPLLTRPFVMFMVCILLFMASGYGMLGCSYLFYEGLWLNHFRHFLTTGAFGLSFYMVMVIISYVHTGRKIEINMKITISVLSLIAATLLRSLIPFFAEYTLQLYLISSLAWSLPFILYMVQFFPYLLAPRVDGIPG